MLVAVVVVYASNSTTTPIAPLLSDAIKISNPDGTPMRQDAVMNLNITFANLTTAPG